MVSTGFSEVIGSWKIIPILLPRIWRTSSSSILITSSPSKMISPDTIFPGGLGIKRKIERALTVFPQPLSPTNPTISPGWMSYETPATACTTPSSV